MNEPKRHGTANFDLEDIGVVIKEFGALVARIEVEVKPAVAHVGIEGHTKLMVMPAIEGHTIVGNEESGSQALIARNRESQLTLDLRLWLHGPIHKLGQALG